MPDMYDKLGDMLNDVLESGKIPPKPPKEAVSEDETASFLHNYTEIIQFPVYIQKALGTLDIAYPFTQKDITKQYHKLLKENHPDTKKTIQVSQNVENIRQKSIDEITIAYKTLCQYFSIK